MRSFIAAGWACLLAACVSAAPPRPSPAPQASAIQPAAAPLSPEALGAHIAVLASDAFEGREPATVGEQKTLDYLIAQFQAAGLEPGFNGAWLQPTPLVTASIAGAPGLFISGPDGVEEYAYGAEQVVWTKREAGRVILSDRELVFVGYGVSAPERNWNDYRGLSMRGKVALILVNDPDFETGQGAFEGKAMTYYGRWIYKLEEAARQGAAGALIIHEDAPAAYPWAVVQSSWTGPQFALQTPDRGASRVGLEGWITADMARKLFARAGLDFDAQKRAAQSPEFQAKPLGLQLSASLETTFERTVSHNVVAKLPGTARPGEAVLYTAHWDHLGRCQPIAGDDICNGAQDNASGTAGLIELARAHAAAGPAARSLLFVAFTAEEQGLLGSAHYAVEPAVPLRDTVAVINMDGLPIHGRTRNLDVIGFGKSELDALVGAAALRQGRAATPYPFPERGAYYRSDHFSLAKLGVPGVFARAGVDLENGGAERGRQLDGDYIAQRYHKPDDEYAPDWDLGGAAQDLELFYTVGRELATGAAWPNWLAGDEFRAVRDAARSGR